MKDLRKPTDLENGAIKFREAAELAFKVFKEQKLLKGFEVTTDPDNGVVYKMTFKRIKKRV